MDLTVSKFLSGLSPSWRSQARGQILGGDSIPTMTTTFFRVMRMSSGADVSPVSFVEQSTMIYGRGRGHGRDSDSDLRGCGSFGGRRSYDGRQWF